MGTTAKHASGSLLVLFGIAASGLAQVPSSYNFDYYDVPGATSTQINSINDRGDITGTYTTPDLVAHAFVRMAGGSTATTFTSPDGNPPGTPVINSRGQIAFSSGSTTYGGPFNLTTSTVYLRSADGKETIPLTPALNGDAVVMGMNDLGQVIGFARTPGFIIAILVGPDGSIPDIKLKRLANYGINNAGQVFWVSNNTFRPYDATAYLDNRDGTPSGKRLDLPSYVGNAAMSENGLVAGTLEQANLGRGFVGDLGSNTYTFLDAPGYQGQTQVNGVNDFGVVVGTVGSYPSQHGFIATPVPVTPILSSGGVANAASYANSAVSPGEVVTLFGAGLGPPALTLGNIDDAGFVGTSVLATRVLFDEIPAPLLYVRGDQVGAVVPYEVSGATSNIQVEYQGKRSNSAAIPVTPAVPGIFTIDASGVGPGIVFNQDGSINTAINPSLPGGIVVFYVTGTGQTLPASTTGKITAVPLAGPILQQPLPITVMIGNAKAQVLYDGPAPTLVSGVSQINAIVPPDAPRGAMVPLTIQVGPATSRLGVTIAIK